MIWDLTRRDFLATAGLTLAAASIPAPLRAAMPQVSPSFGGKIHIIGLNTPPGVRPSDYAVPNSILTTIDIQSGAVKRSELPLNNGHAALPLGEGRVACISHHGVKSCVIDADHTVMKNFQVPENYLFGGHALVLPERKVFVVPIRHAKQQTASDHGKFLVYDLETLKELDQVTASALHPHEMRLIPGTDEIAVTHYGDINAPHPYYWNNVVAPALVIYDSKTLQQKRTFMTKDYDAMLTHMDVAPDGHAYCVLTQYFRVPVPDPTLDLKEQRRIAIETIEKSVGPLDFPVLDQGVIEGRVAMPLPVLRINTKTGEIQPLMPDAAHQIRSQSVACNKVTSMAAATYFHADTLFLHRPNEEPRILTGKDIGLPGIRGVSDIPDTPYIVVSGSEKDALILDTRTLDVISRFSADNETAPHVEYEKA